MVLRPQEPELSLSHDAPSDLRVTERLFGV